MIAIQVETSRKLFRAGKMENVNLFLVLLRKLDIVIMLIEFRALAAIRP